MKKTIGLLVFGLIFGLSVCFSSGSPELVAAGAIVGKEVERLATGVDFGNPAEVRAFETALRNNNAFKGYLNGIRSIWGDSITEDYLIEQAVEDQRSRQERERKKQEEIRLLGRAEAWAASNIPEGVVLFDLAMQQRIMKDFERNIISARENTKQYIGRWFQYVGKVVSAKKETNYRDNSEYFFIHLKREEGATVFAYFTLDQAVYVQQIKNDDLIVVGGMCSRFVENSSSPFGLSSVALENSIVRAIADK